MRSRTARWLAGAILLLTLVLTALGFWPLLFLRQAGTVWLWTTLAFLAFPVVGAIIVFHRPRQPIGWLFCAIGLANSLSFAAESYAVYTLVTRPGSLPAGAWAVWVQSMSAGVIWYLFFFTLLLFPTGQPPSPQWRPMLWAGIVVTSLFQVVLAFRPGTMLEVHVVSNPLGLEQIADLLALAEAIIMPIAVVLGLAFASSVVVRFRTARGDEREQLKWFAYVVGLFIAQIVVILLNEQVFHSPLLGAGIDIWGALNVAAAPMAVGIAVLRYRLYDIERLIRATLIYGVITGLLGLAYVGSVVLLQAGFRTLTGQSSELAIIISTLVIAALFHPVRGRVRREIDRRFYREQYDATRTLAAFGVHLRDEVDLPTLTQELESVVRRTMQPAHVSLWIRPSSFVPRSTHQVDSE